MQLTPQSGMAASRAMAARRSPSFGSSGTVAEAKMTAARVPALAASARARSRPALATERMARSTGWPMAAIEGRQGKPSTSEYLGLIAQAWPSKTPVVKASGARPE